MSNKAQKSFLLYILYLSKKKISKKALENGQSPWAPPLT